MLVELRLDDYLTAHAEVVANGGRRLVELQREPAVVADVRPDAAEARRRRQRRNEMRRRQEMNQAAMGGMAAETPPMSMNMSDPYERW